MFGNIIYDATNQKIPALGNILYDATRHTMCSIPKTHDWGYNVFATP